MYAGDGQAARARWEVLWTKDGRVVKHEFGSDFAEALRIYTLAVEGERKAVTLRCANMQFAPPDRLADREEVIVIKNGKRYKGKQIKEPRTYQETMATYNLKGIWWCSYCVKLRKFVKREGYKEKATGRYIPDPHMACPMCGVSHRLLVKYNPLAARLTSMPASRIPDPNADTKNRERRAARRRARKAATADG